MSPDARRFRPGTRMGWLSAALGFGVLLVILMLFVLSDNLTNGGTTMAPIWLRLVIIGGVWLIDIPAIITGFRVRHTDRSVLGTIALVIACVLGAWFTLTGVAGLFFQ